MKITDSHVHLYPEPVLEKECNVSQEPANELLSKLSQKLSNKKISQAVLYILDKAFLSMDVTVPENLIISSVAGFNGTYKDDLERAFVRGIKIIKILPYEQKITRHKYPDVIEMTKVAKEKGMVLTVCSAYGSKLLYETNGVELAAYIKKEVDIPIILAHAGGPRIFDAMSLALEYEDVFLDLSFSLKYWWNSSVINDYAFAIKKLESKRCFYGSDYPYVDFDESMEFFLRFTNEHNFSEQEKNNMLCDNFDKFKDRYL